MGAGVFAGWLARREDEAVNSVIQAGAVRMRRLVVAAVLLLTSLLSAADPPAEHAHRLVLLAPKGPVLIQLRLETGSLSIRQVRDAFCDSLFKRLDADKSDKLEAAEQTNLPMFQRSGGGVAAAVEPFLAEGVLTDEGLRKYIDSQLGPLVSVETRAPRADQTVRLQDALDLDRNGVLSVDEVINAAKALSRYDLDDDESLSVNELQPFPQSVRQAQRQQAVAEGRGSRVFLLDGASAFDRVMEEMKKLDPLPDGLELARCGLKPGTDKYDQDSNGRLETEELRRWMMEGEPDVEIAAVWREPGRGLPPLLTVTSPESPRLVPGKAVSKRTWNVAIDGVSIEMNLADNRSSATYAANLFVTKAITLDRDANRYLDEAEFAGLGTSAPFAAVDLNHDGMVKNEEIRQYFQEMSRLSQTRVVMTFGDDVISLFQVMDSDKSNRLSPREMLTLRERVEPFDRNANGEFDSSDFISKYTLSLAFSTPEGMEFTPMGMSSMNQTGGVKRTFRTGPVWYQRMDRNRDHDISWREFLGPRAKFDAVDTDHDGLISREEAEAADAKAKEASAEAGAAGAP